MSNDQAYAALGALCDDAVEVSRLLEALLFVADVPVEVTALAGTLGCPQDAIAAGLSVLAERVQQGGLRLQQFRDSVQLVTAPTAAPFVERFLGLDLSSKLSAAAVETLAIIAYRQPITRMDIEQIRGVNSGGVLRTLLARELIEEVGRLESVGHPILYGTTFQFLRYFGLSSLDALPAPDTGSR